MQTDLVITWGYEQKCQEYTVHVLLGDYDENYQGACCRKYPNPACNTIANIKIQPYRPMYTNKMPSFECAAMSLLLCDMGK